MGCKGSQGGLPREGDVCLYRELGTADQAREGSLCGWGVIASCMLLSPERRRWAEVRVGDATPSVVSSGTALTVMLRSLNSTLRAAGNQEWFLLVEGGRWAP